VPPVASQGLDSIRAHGIGGGASRDGGRFALVGATAVFVLLGALWGAAVAAGGGNAAILCAAFVAALFVFLDFRVGVVLLVLLMPISSSTFFPRALLGVTGLNPLNLLMLATLASFLLAAMIEKDTRYSLRRFMPKRAVWMYLVPLAIAGWLGARHVGEIPGRVFELELATFGDTAGYWRDMVVKPIMMVIFAFLVGAAVSRAKEPRWFLAPTLVSIWVMCFLVIGFVLAAGVGLGQIAGGATRTFLSPLGLHANDLGRMYVVAYALLLFTFTSTRNYLLQALLLGSMGLVFIALVLTFSRGAFVGFVIVNAIYLLWHRSVLTWLAGGVAFAVLLWRMPGALSDRITAGFDGGTANSVTAGRVDEIWLPLLPEFWKSPIWGQGHGSIMWSDAMKSGTILEVSHPHNAYIQALFDMGILGLVLMCAFFWYIMRDLFRLGRDTTLPSETRGFFQGAAAGLIGFLIAGFAGSSLTPAPEQSFLWLAIGAMYGVLATRPAR
jgi:O-antigen ligase